MNLVAVAVADYTGLILLVALLSSSRIRRSNNETFEMNLFTKITFLTLVACFVDVFAFVVDGKTGFWFRIINIAANTFCFVANPIFIASWCLYEDLKLYHSRKRVKKIYTYAFIPAVVMAFIAVVNIFVPIIFTIDQNNVYSRLPFSYVYYLVDFGYVVFSIYILRKYEKQYGKVRFFPLYLMVGPIFLGCFLQAVFYGISLIWVSLAVGLTAMYMALQNEFSYLDKLTGLYNRAYLDYILENAVKDKKVNLGGIMIDVDYFKNINDSFGHSVGDEALIDVARVLTFAKPDKGIAIRFAGDEFMILIRGTSEKELDRIAGNIREETNIFNEAEQRQYKLSLSVGYAIMDAEKGTVDQFLKSMDDNMYQEKEGKHSADK
jgi:diguanylate cyclase (GGDEF)-like protein